MKVLVNGGLNLLELDGWWAEAYGPEVGWALGDGASTTATATDAPTPRRSTTCSSSEVVPEFYDRDASGIPRAWVARIRASMAQLTPRFSSNRMVREYVEAAYLPAARQVVHRTRDGGREGQAIDEWARRLRAGWSTIRFGRLAVDAGPLGSTVRLEAYLGEVPVESCRVEAYADAVPGAAGVVVALAVDHPIAGAVNGHVLMGTLPAGRPLDDFTIRVVPHHAAVAVPLEASWIRWGPRVSENAPWSTAEATQEAAPQAAEPVGIPIIVEPDAAPAPTGLSS